MCRRLLALVLVLAVSDPLLAAASNIRRWRERPEAFVFENFGVTPDEWQGDVLRAFVDPAQPRISMQACVGPGKTAVMAWCAWIFLSCYGDIGEHPKGLAFAITSDNLRDNLWAEMAKWQARSAYLSAAFTWQAERIFANHHPNTWFLAARTWPKTASPDEQAKTIAGLHGKYVAAFADESGAIPVPVLRGGEQMLSTKPLFGKFLQAGNPISLEGMLYAAATQLRHLWTVIKITGDPDDPKRSPRIDLDWAREQIATWGRDNPWIMSSLLGQFPPASINALLGIEDVEVAMRRHLPDDAFTWSQKRLGVDVARYGDDRTVIFPRQGLAAFRPIVMRHKRNTSVSVDIANRVMGAKRQWGSELELMDATGGWAAGASDVMRANGVIAIDVQFHNKQTNDPRYYNRRAELWFGMAKWIQTGGAMPLIPEMVAELTTPTYTFKDGKFLVEPKELIKKRLGRSPDLADGLALTFGLPDMPAAVIGQAQQAGHVAHDADPYATEDRA
jgi:phage terminase large subunit